MAQEVSITHDLGMSLRAGTWRSMTRIVNNERQDAVNFYCPFCTDTHQIELANVTDRETGETAPTFPPVAQLDGVVSPDIECKGCGKAYTAVLKDWHRL